MTTTETPETFSMDEVVAELRKRGHEAFVEHTGGGCSTIFVGPTVRDEAGDERYTVAAGAGGFAGPNWTDPIGYYGEFVVGSDTDDEDFVVVPDGASVAEIADLAETYVRKSA